MLILNIGEKEVNALKIRVIIMMTAHITKNSVYLQEIKHTKLLHLSNFDFVVVFVNMQHKLKCNAKLNCEGNFLKKNCYFVKKKFCAWNFIKEVIMNGERKGRFSML